MADLHGPHGERKTDIALTNHHDPHTAKPPANVVSDHLYTPIRWCPPRTALPLPLGPRLRAIDILFVCTGNICRSPAAEALLRHRLEQSGVAAHVHSAGVLEEGNPAHSHGVAILSERGLDLSSHRSRAMTAELVRRADLILAMARQHVQEAVVSVPREEQEGVFPRTFTLKELVRRGRQVGPRRSGEPLEEWLAKANEGRTKSELLGFSREDDVDDPIGQSRAAYERMVTELDGLIDELVWLVWGEAGDAGTEQSEQSEQTERKERAS